MMNKILLEMKIMSLIKDIREDCNDIYDYITNWKTEFNREDIIIRISEIDDSLDILNEVIERIERVFEEGLIKDE